MPELVQAQRHRPAAEDEQHDPGREEHGRAGRSASAVPSAASTPPPTVTATRSRNHGLTRFDTPRTTPCLPNGRPTGWSASPGRQHRLAQSATYSAVLTSLSFAGVRGGGRVNADHEHADGWSARRLGSARTATGLLDGPFEDGGWSGSTADESEEPRTGRSARCAPRPTRRRSSRRRAAPPGRPSASARAARCGPSAWSTRSRTTSASASGAGCPSGSAGACAAPPSDRSARLAVEPRSRSQVA